MNDIGFPAFNLTNLVKDFKVKIAHKGRLLSAHRIRSRNKWRPYFTKHCFKPGKHIVIFFALQVESRCKATLNDLLWLQKKF